MHYFKMTFSACLFTLDVPLLLRQNFKRNNELKADLMISVSYIRNLILRQKIAVKFPLYSFISFKCK